MDYKNLSLRFINSLILISIYTFLIYINSNLIIILCIIIYFIIFYEIFKYFKINTFKILIINSISLLFFIIYASNSFNIIYFNLLILIIISFDISSYFFGSFFGKTKILKNLSPKKSLEGFIAGIIFSNLTSFLYIYYYNIILNTFFYTNLIILSAFIGDLINSYFKRINNLKDSSLLLPGHGGFYDRFDSFIICIIIHYLINYFI